MRRPTWHRHLTRTLNAVLVGAAAAAMLAATTPDTRDLNIAPAPATPAPPRTVVPFSLLEDHDCWTAADPRPGVLPGSAVVTLTPGAAPLWTGDLDPRQASVVLDDAFNQALGDPRGIHAVHGLCGDR